MRQLAKNNRIPTSVHTARGRASLSRNAEQGGVKNKSEFLRTAEKVMQDHEETLRELSKR